MSLNHDSGAGQTIINKIPVKISVVFVLLDSWGLGLNYPKIRGGLYTHLI